MAERASRRRCRDVPDVQRARLLEAMAEVVADHGLRGASASRVASRAGVSRETFVKQFEDPDDCFLALLDWMLDRAEGLIFNAFSQAPSWRDGVLDGLESLLGFLDQEPVRTRVCLLERVPANSTALEPRVRALDRLGLLVDERAREELSLERQPPAAMFEATIGSVLVLLRRRLLNGDAPPFGALLGELVEVVVAPYLGPSAAVRAASVGRRRAQVLLDASPIDPARHELEIPDLLRHANAHRRRLCVRYLSQNPGASNQAVSAAIGVSHSGQVSVLLSRLWQAGLLEKRAGGAGRPNAWSLSSYGVKVVRALERW